MSGAGVEYTGWEIGIIEHALVPASELLANPFNWRTHGRIQQQAMEATLEDLGWLDEILVNKTTGHIIDGHMRVALAVRAFGADTMVPVKYCALSAQKERKALALYNPLGELAGADNDMHEQLVSAIAQHDETDLALLELLNAPLWDDVGSADGDEEWDDRSAVAARDDDQEPSRDDDDDDTPTASAADLDQEPLLPPVKAGQLLARVEVTIADPETVVMTGDVWELGLHVLYCCDVLLDWWQWTVDLHGEGTVFAPYPGPLVPLTTKADQYRIVMVQPDPYIAGHIIDNYRRAMGDGGVRRREKAS